VTDPVFDNIVPNTVRSAVTQHGVRISPTDALRKLEPGKSFTVDTDQHRRIVVSAAYRLGISIRTAKDEGGNGYRVWLAPKEKE
jgi:hypothetical protein